MIPVANVALLLEQRRLRAWKKAREAEEGAGGHLHPGPSNDVGGPSTPPRVLVIGPESSGKTSLCKMLVNYGVRTLPGWTPILANLDTSDVNLLFSLMY